MNSSRLKLMAAAILLCLMQILPQRAIAQVSGILQIAQSAQDRKAEADRLYDQGSQQYQTSQFRDALQSYQQALSLYQEIDDRASEGTIINNIGEVYRNLGQYPQALKHYQQALIIRREVGDRAGEGVIINNIGVVYARLGQYPQALEQYQQALIISREADDRATEGVTINNIGAVYDNLGQYPQALEQYQLALVIRREVGDRAGEGATINNIGLIYRNLGQYPQALEQYQLALVISREVGDRAGEGATINNIGEVYRNLGQYPQALEQCQLALVISREVGDRAGEGATINNIGEVYRNLGQNLQALESFQQALITVREVGDRAGEGRTLNNIGFMHDSLGEYSQALESFQQALTTAREVGDRRAEGIIFTNMGKSYHHVGQNSQALKHHQQALVIQRELDDQQGEGITLSNLGDFYRSLGQYPQALESYQQGVSIFREIGDRAREGTTLNNLGFIYLASGDVEASTKTLFDAVEVLESLRSSELADADKVSLFDKQLGTYDGLQQALIAQNQFETALEVAERGRARAFAELLAQRSSSQPDSSVASIPKPSIAQIKQIAREQNSTLIEYSIAYTPVKVEGREEWQPSKLYIWVVKPTGDIDFRSVDLTATDVPFATLLNLTRQAIGARGRGAAPALPPQIARQPEQTNLRLQQLHQVLIDPIADLLPTNPNDPVIFIPQGELFLVPFPALQAANGKYLIQSHTILTAPSIQVLGLTQQPSQARSLNPSEVLIVGNPTMPSLPSLPPDPPRQLPALSGTQQEAIAIARQFRTQPLLGNAATETTVVQRMAKARIIHLATHGLLEYGNPKASGVRDVPGAIALTPSAQDDGLLTSSEILNLKLNNSLVVLSACDTGRGDITGDGVIGLSRSLLSAGASSVIASLWKVPDDSTAALMTEFYTQLQQQPDRAQALRQAMLKTMVEYPDPIDWAAFTLIGETEN
jgi:CHAT domain-containing protein/tetratricopeptide (TPR) repeat protein